MCHESRVEVRAARHRQLQQVAQRHQLHQAVRQQLNDSEVMKFPIMLSREKDGRLMFKTRENLIRIN